MTLPLRLVSITLLLSFSLAASDASATDIKDAPKTIPELQAAIEAVLKETRTPGAAVAIVSREKTEWIACFGKADVAANRPVTADTLFRLGSISKTFAAVAAMQLQEAGKLKLTDTVHQWAPDVAFTNPWEATDPVRLVHLMEHTSGFGDMRLREFALDDPTPMSLRDALAFGASSRVSRWPPGTRMAYCNSGPAVLAAVIEKVSGERFEDYVQENIFKPLHMRASYLYTPDVQQRLATLYHADGVTPYSYWHIGLRPTAAAQASINDMANYVRFYLQRGSLDGAQLLQPASIERIETCETMPSAKLGPMNNYGLFNYPILEGSFIFHGHNGAVLGGVARFDYLPEQGCGYAILLNSGSFRALIRIGEMLQQHLTNGLTAPPLPPLATVPGELRKHYQGHYQLISPADQWSYGLERLVNVKTFSFTTAGLSTSTYGFMRNKWVPVSERLFRLEDESLAQIALLPDADGKILVQYGILTFKKISPWRFWPQTIGSILVAVLVLSSLVWIPIWIWKTAIRRRRISGPLTVWLLPTLSAIFLIAFDALLIIPFRGIITSTYVDDLRLSGPTILTLCVLFTSIGFPLVAIAALYACYRERHTPMKRRWVYWHSILVATAVTATAIYFGYWGLIGLRLWTI